MEEQKATQPETSPAVETAKAPAPALKAILGRKVGMTRIYNSAGVFIPVTVVEAGPCPIIQVKTQANDGYEALQLGFGAAKAKNVDKALTGHFSRAGVPACQWVREIRVKKTDGFQAGQEIRAAQFSDGDVVDVSGTSKGKGFAGVVKRHRFRGGPRTHGQSDRTRAPGASGGQDAQRVFKGKGGPGHMGAVWATTQRLKVVHVRADDNVLLIEGSVPGPNGGFIVLQSTIRPRKAHKTQVPAKVAAKKAAKPAAKEAAKPAAKPEKK